MKRQLFNSFTDMTTFEQKAETSIILGRTEAKDSQFQLLYGKLKANIKKMLKDGSMENECSQAVAGIKGTELILQDDGSTTTRKVLEGTVEFRSLINDATVIVNTGEMIQATQGGLGSKQSFDVDSEIALWQSSTANENPPQNLIQERKPGRLAVAAVLIMVVVAVAFGVLLIVIVAGVMLSRRNSKK